MYIRVAQKKKSVDRSKEAKEEGKELEATSAEAAASSTGVAAAKVTYMRASISSPLITSADDCYCFPVCSH